MTFRPTLSKKERAERRKEIVRDREAGQIKRSKFKFTPGGGTKPGQISVTRLIHKGGDLYDRFYDEHGMKKKVFDEEIEKLQRLCNEWNRKYSKGTAVIVTRDDETTFETRTKTIAQVLNNHSAVIWVVGIAGCYLLERVRAIEKNMDEK